MDMAASSSFRGGGGSHSWIRVGWKPPSMGIFKLNTDGASKGNPGKSGAGGLIRNHEGRWVAGFCHNIGTTNSLEAELSAIRDGLELVNRLKLMNVDIETDSKLAVQLIAGSIFRGDHVNNLVCNCRRLMAEIGSTTLRHVYREANACADILANLGVVADGLEVFAKAPSCVGHQLHDDSIGIEYLRQMKYAGRWGSRGSDAAHSNRVLMKDCDRGKAPGPELGFPFQVCMPVGGYA